MDRWAGGQGEEGAGIPSRVAALSCIVHAHHGGSVNDLDSLSPHLPLSEEEEEESLISSSSSESVMAVSQTA